MAHNGSRYFRWKALTAAAESCLIKWSKTFRATLRVLRERPRILVLPILVFTALLASGLASVLTASQVAVRNARDLASNGIGSQVALSLEEALLIATFGSELLAAVTSRLADCSVLAAQWADLSTDIMSRVDSDVVKQLELDFAGVIWKTWPPLEGELAELLYGRDLLREPDDRTGMIYMLTERHTLMLGPYNCRAGFKCGFVVTPVFLPAPSEAYDWGCGLQPYNCSDLCWDPVNKTKFHSQVSTMINLEPLLTGTDARLQSLASRGYLYRLWQANTSPSNPYFLLGNSSRLPVDPMTLPISLYNVQWYLEIAPAAGWVPAWRSPCIAVVVVGSVAVSLLVLWLLVSKEQHNRLLKAMLPGKVIKQLQAGENAIAQEYSDVTVLFSDIVGYTTVASQLSPCQVVTLLNELFGMFDELTQRNGVYKVETIGDALMCVAGCPVPDDAVRNAVRAANMALDMVRAVEQFKPSLEGVRVQIRVGLHSGPVVAGVVGKKMPRFCLFGDTVNTASRMESSSLPMQIQVSDATATLLRGRGEDFVLESRGIIDIKGKGAMETFFLAAGASPLPRGKSFLAALQRPAALVVRPPPQPAKLQHAIGAGSGANGSYSDLLRAATSGGRRSGDRHSAEDRSSGKRSSRMIYSGGNGGSRALADVSEEGVALSGAAAVGSQSSKLMGADAGASDVEASSFEMRPAKASCQADGILAEVSGDDAVGGGAAATSWPSPAAPAYGCGSAEPSPVHRPLKRRFLDGRAAADCPPREPATHTGVAGVGAGTAVGGSGAEAEAGAVFEPPSFAEGLGEEVGVTAVHAGGTPATPGLHRLAVHSGKNPHGPRGGVRSPAGAAPDVAADDWATRSHAQDPDPDPDPDPDHQQQQRPESSFATRPHAALRAMADAAKAQAGTDSAVAVVWRRPAAVATVARVAGARGVGAAGSLRAARRLQDDETVTAGDATATVTPPATAAARAQAQVGELDAEPLWSAHSWSRQLTAETPHAADARSVSMRQALRGLFRNLTSGRSSEAGSGSATPHAPHAATAAAPAQPPSSQRRVRALCHSSSLDLLQSATRSAAATEPGQAAIGQLASLGSGSATPTRIFPLGSGDRSRGVSGAFQLLPQTALATSVGARTPTTRPSTETGVISVAVATHGQQH